MLIVGNAKGSGDGTTGPTSFPLIGFGLTGTVPIGSGTKGESASGTATITIGATFSTDAATASRFAVLADGSGAGVASTTDPAVDLPFDLPAESVLEMLTTGRHLSQVLVQVFDSSDTLDATYRIVDAQPAVFTVTGLAADIQFSASEIEVQFPASGDAGTDDAEPDADDGGSSGTVTVGYNIGQNSPN